ncbi:hypothetical protein Tco_1059925 [Tanacetum coccineum]
MASLLKWDFEKEKAFEFLKWDFLDLVMEKLGFGIKWRSWIKGCLHNARASVLVNGSLRMNSRYLEASDKVILYLLSYLFWLWKVFMLSSVKAITMGMYKRPFMGSMVVFLKVQRIVQALALGNGVSIRFWEDVWSGTLPLKSVYPCVFLLDSDRNCNVANRVSLLDWSQVLRRTPRGGIEATQFADLSVRT